MRVLVGEVYEIKAIILVSTIVYLLLCRFYENNKNHEIKYY